MKKTLVILTGLVVSLSSCTISKHARMQDQQTEVALREVKSETEDFRYQLNSFEVEMQVLEGKVNSQEGDLGELRQHFLDVSHDHKTLIDEKLARLEKNILMLEGKDSLVKKDLSSLKDNAHDTVASLGQFKEKIDENVQIIEQQTRYIESLKEALASLIKIVEDQKDMTAVKGLKVYTVKPGDSLERIARENDTTVANLKNTNDLRGDLIVVGQKLQVP